MWYNRPLRDELAHWAAHQRLLGPITRYAIMAHSQDRNGRASLPTSDRSSRDAYDLYFVRRHRLWRPPTDVYETQDQVIVKVEVPGMAEGDFEIALDDGCLVISGNRPDTPGKLVYHNIEIRYGAFRSEVRIDWQVDSSAIEATYERGFLLVSIPKAKQHRIPVVIGRSRKHAEES